MSKNQLESKSMNDLFTKEWGSGEYEILTDLLTKEWRSGEYEIRREYRIHGYDGMKFEARTKLANVIKKKRRV